MNTAKRQVSPGLTFAAGTLVGAIAVFVPLKSAGHPGSRVEGPAKISPGEVRPSVDAASASRLKEDASEPREASNEATCDVQLD